METLKLEEEKDVLKTLSYLAQECGELDALRKMLKEELDKEGSKKEDEEITISLSKRQLRQLQQLANEGYFVRLNTVSQAKKNIKIYYAGNPKQTK